MMNARAAQFNRIGPTEDNLVVHEQRAVLERRLQHRAQSLQQRLVVARYPFAQRLADILVRAAGEVADNDRYESADIHALLFRGHTDALGEAVPDAHKRSLGDLFVGAGMDQIRNQHGILRFVSCFSLLPLVCRAAFALKTGAFALEN
ncbi:hypothetical protein [Methylocystis sp. S23]